MRTDGPATTPPPDLRVGEYRLLARIGEGGMGVVHLAEAPDGRRLALKVLRPHVVGDDESRERLAREVSSLSRVRSPWVAEIVDADPWGPMPYVATRYVPGPSLHQHVRQHGPLAGGDLTMLAGGLAEATAAVHAVGVLHRDVKPSNVLLEGRRPVLIDFGLARLADDPRLTATGWLLGTPGYLAPEVLYGDDPTPAADVHAWAATVVFAATGRPPYGTGPAMAVMDRTRRGEHDLRGVPEHLVPLLRDALAADPHQRPTLPEVLGRLRRGSDPDRPAPQGTDRTTDQATMPIALALHDEDQDAEPTDVWDRPDATRPLTAPVQQPLRPVAAPQRAPYEQPAPPRERLAEPVPARQPRSSRLQRSLLLGGLAALVALWFAAAPYLTLAGVAAATWLLRTWSWTSEASQDRVWRRGRRRWYDGLVSTVSAPWYLLVASAGTLLLLLTATLLASLAGLALLVLGAGTGALLTVAGAVLVGGLWWGPGARRVRRPTRRSAGVLTSRRWSGWAAVLVVATLTLLAAYLLSTDGTSWQPMPGAPWRSGTLLGRLSGWL